MAVEYISIGTVASGAAAITVGLPATRQTNDLLLLIVETANQPITLTGTDAANWVQIASSPQGTGTADGTAATRLAVYSRRVDGTEANIGIGDSGNHQIAIIVCYRGVHLSTPFNVQSGSVRATAGTAVTYPSVTTTVNDCLILLIESHSLPDSNSTAITSGHTNANLTGITERADNNTNAGNGGGFSLAEGLKATAGSTGTSSATVTTSSVGGMITLALTPAPETQTLTPNQYANSNVTYSPTVAPALYVISPAIYENANDLFTPIVSLELDKLLQPSLYTNVNSIFAPTVIKGAVTLQPEIYSNNQTFFSQTVSTVYALLPSRYDNSQIFYDHLAFIPGPLQTITQNQTFINTIVYWDEFTWDEFTWDSNAFYRVTLTIPGRILPELFVNTQTFYSAQITTGAVTITFQDWVEPGHVESGWVSWPSFNSQQFYTNQVFPGSVSLAAPIVTNTNVIYSAALSYSLDAGLYTNNNTFYQSTVNRGPVTLTASLYTNSSTFYAHTVTPGAVTLSPSLYANTNTFYTPTINRGAVALTPDLYTNNNTFYAPVITVGSKALTLEIFVNNNTFYAHSLATGAVTLLPSRFANTNLIYPHEVSDGSVIAAISNHVVIARRTIRR